MRNFTSVIFIVFSVQGCANYTSAVDNNFGASVKEAVFTQSANSVPKSSLNQQAPVDGQAAKSAVDRYQQSFEAPSALPAGLNTGAGAIGAAAH